jgi:phospholipid-binding lipoprotein MlaA
MAALFSLGCASTKSQKKAEQGAFPGSSDVVPVTAAGAVADVDSSSPEPVRKPNPDPWEPVNRKIFAFNDVVDTWLLVPIATLWDTVLPDPVQRSIARFRDNLAFPADLANNLLQGKGGDAIEGLGRFVINSTVGFAGLFDPASDLGYGPKQEDLGQTLGVWGVPSGPYLVLPLFGPSSPRDFAGRIGDGFASVYPYILENEAAYIYTAVGVINERAFLLDTVRNAKAASLDYYAALRNAYLQRRMIEINDGRPEALRPSQSPDESEDDLYFFDEEEPADENE